MSPLAPLPPVLLRQPSCLLPFCPLVEFEVISFIGAVLRRETVSETPENLTGDMRGMRWRWSTVLGQTGPELLIQGRPPSG